MSRLRSRKPWRLEHARSLAPSEVPLIAYALTIFSGAFLLFQVQPLIAKYILPWFGGGPGVWVVCMLFFQLLLLGGYTYAHLSTRWLRVDRSAALHLAVLVLAVVALPIAPDDSWRPRVGDEPTLRILLLLGASIGVPYFALSATGPLLQRWYSVERGEAAPYRLFALSNLGSLLALLSYPFLIEPTLSRSAQAEIWSFSLVVFALACGWCAFGVWRKARGAASQSSVAPPAAEPAPSRGAYVMWLSLSAIASFMLLGVTNRLSENAAVVPFLWILPLAVYLISFIACFENPRWYLRLTMGFALLVCLAEAPALRAQGLSLAVSIPANMAVLLVVCMICHGELYRLRPHPRHLTGFYLTVSAGGALGGLLVAVVAPLVFVRPVEFEIGLLACSVLAVVAYLRDGGGASRLAWAPLIVGYLGLGAVLAWNLPRVSDRAIYAARDFHGTLTVEESGTGASNAVTRTLYHGAIIHGSQIIDSGRAGLPTAYYGEHSGVGRALAALRTRDGGLRVGMVGLGVGTLAAYSRPDDEFRFYEINPRVAKLAEQYFSFLADARGEVTVAIGDARLSLEREPPHGFDLLVLDAFSADAVPAHLLTREAFDLYLGHLKPDGVIAVHVSNTYLDLSHIVGTLAIEFGLTAMQIGNSPPAERWWVLGSDWVLISRNQQFFDSEWIAPVATRLEIDRRSARTWTDDHVSLFEIVRTREPANP